MKELTATFHSEVFRPVVTLVIPGFYAISTLSIVFWQHAPGLHHYVNDFPGLAATIMLLTVLTVGLIAEEIGARLEIHFDKVLEKTDGYKEHTEEWFAYLRLAFDREPIGHRYLRSLVLRLKFELGMTVASVPFVLGALLLQIPWICRSVLLAVSVLLAIYLWLEAKSSDKNLSDLRREMLKKNWEPPTPPTRPSPASA
jgi:hypothetical protein